MSIYKSVWVLVSALLFVQSAQAFQFSVVGEGNSTQGKSDPSSYTYGGFSISEVDNSKMGFGGGALLGFDLAPMIGFETGALYINRKFETQLTVLGVTETIDTSEYAIQIPLLLRLRLTQFLSIGAGGYAAIGTGNVTINNDNKLSSGTPSTTTESYASYGTKNKDYGLLFSLALNLPLSSSAGLLVDGRYAMGLTDVNGEPDQSSPSVKQTYRDIQLLVGIAFNFGSDYSRY